MEGHSRALWIAGNLDARGVGDPGEEVGFMIHGGLSKLRKNGVVLS